MFVNSAIFINGARLHADAVAEEHTQQLNTHLASRAAVSHTAYSCTQLHYITQITHT